MNHDDGGINLSPYLPNVRRARGGYIYTQDNQRFLDLWLHDGYLIKGHQNHSLLQTAKNTLSRSFFLEYPNIWHNKALTVALQLFKATDICFTSSSLHSIPFQESWHFDHSGCYILRSGLDIPHNVRIAKLAIVLSGYTCLLFFNSEPIPPYVHKHVLPAYISRIFLKQLAHFSLDKNQKSVRMTKFFNYHNSYFYWNTKNNISYPDYFLRALEHNILLPPHIGGTGLWIPELFSDGQNNLIETFINQN